MALVVADVEADQQLGAGFLDVLVDAVGAVAGVHQVEGGPHHVGCVEQIDQLRGHDADAGDDIPLGHAGSPQGRSSLFHLDKQGGVGDLIAVIHQGNVGQMVFVLAADVVKGSAVRGGHIPELGFVGCKPGPGLGCIHRLFGDRHNIPFFG